MYHSPLMMLLPLMAKQVKKVGDINTIEIKTGNKIWDVNVVNNSVKTETIENLGAINPLKEDFVSGGTGVGMNMAPVIYNNKVIIGITGVGYGLHVDQDKDAPLGSV